MAARTAPRSRQPAPPSLLMSILVSRVFLYAIMITVGIMWAVPILWMIVTSLKPPEEIFAYPVNWLPRVPTLDYYAGVFQRFPMLLWFRNSLIVATITTVLTLIVDTLAAYPLARLQFRGRTVILLVILSTFLLPREILLVPLFLGLSKLGISDTYFSLAVPAAANAFGVFLLTQFFGTLPIELEDAATIDGCTRLGFLWRIVVPLSRPALASVAIFTFVGSWNEFFWPLIVTNSDKTRTVPVGLSALVASAGMSTSFGITMAAAGVATLPAVIFFLILQRYFVKGIATTGLK